MKFDFDSKGKKGSLLFLKSFILSLASATVLTLCFFPSLSLEGKDSFKAQTAEVSFEEATNQYKIKETKLQTKTDSEEKGEILLVPCGTPFGIKMLTQGAVVVGVDGPYNNIPSGKGAREAGIKTGDIIISYGGKKVFSNEDVKEATKKSGDKKIEIIVKRDGEKKKLFLTPYFSEEEGEFKAGMWLRDSSAGIGTMTFYDPKTRQYAGLGHAICDEDTARLMPLGKGEIVKSTVIGIRKGDKNSAGELRGIFVGNEPTGSLDKNTDQGVFGRLYSLPIAKSPLPLGKKEEVKKGSVQIITTIKGQLPMAYGGEITHINSLDGKTKNLIIEITDPRLLNETGGIVQGMSGSPIIQNGKLVGAVTHVFVGDQKKGYGIFAENMYRELVS